MFFRIFRRYRLRFRPKSFSYLWGVLHPRPVQPENGLLDPPGARSACRAPAGISFAAARIRAAGLSARRGAGAAVRSPGGGAPLHFADVASGVPHPLPPPFPPQLSPVPRITAGKRQESAWRPSDQRRLTSGVLCGGSGHLHTVPTGTRREKPDGNRAQLPRRLAQPTGTSHRKKS